MLLRPSDLPPERLHFGIPSSKQPLAEALDLALAATSQAQRDALARRWLPPPQWSASAQMALSQADYMGAVVGEDAAMWKPIPGHGKLLASA